MSTLPGGRFGWEEAAKVMVSVSCSHGNISLSTHKPLHHIEIKSSLTCQGGVGVRISASNAPSRTYSHAHITPIDADDARQYALDEIDGGEAKAEAHQEELPSDATINR